jgi:glycosyltransferase involved in cell wall biosynthesis
LPVSSGFFFALPFAFSSAKESESKVTIRTLHLDIEGGWGGSSRSLYELLIRFERERIDPIVVHRQKGPLVNRYRRLQIPTFHVPEIVSFAPRTKKSGRIFLSILPLLRLLPRCVRTLVEISRKNNVELIHLNHEGLFLVARALKKRLGLPIACHSRILVEYNMWGRWLVRTLCSAVDHMFYISPKEKERFLRLKGKAPLPGDVVWNISSICTASRAFHDTPEAIYLGNIDHRKGTDRLLDIAIALEELSAPQLLISIYGMAREKNKFAEDLKARIAELNLSHRIQFRGYTESPEKIFPRAFALIRPSRVNDPWGRDVIEAISNGVPVLATGTFDGVVEPGVNGFLFYPFDARQIAARLIDLLENGDLWNRLSKAGIEKGQRKFSGKEQAHLVSSVFEALVTRRYSDNVAVL